RGLERRPLRVRTPRRVCLKRRRSPGAQDALASAGCGGGCCGQPLEQLSEQGRFAGAEIGLVVQRRCQRDGGCGSSGPDRAGGDGWLVMWFCADGGQRGLASPSFASARHRRPYPEGAPHDARPGPHRRLVQPAVRRRHPAPFRRGGRGAGVPNGWLGGGRRSWGELELIEEVLDATSTITVATAIVNMWTNDPATIAMAYQRIARRHPDRFLL